MSQAKTATFVRVEGTLVERGLLASSTYMASHAQSIPEKFLRLSTLAAAPFSQWLAREDRSNALRLSALALKGMSEDRIAVLGQEYFEDFLKPRQLQAGIDLLRQAKRQGDQVILLSEALSVVVEPLATAVGSYDHLFCNQLEFKNGEATGRLLEPVIGGYETGRFIREFAASSQIDLSRSRAYASFGSDLLLLASVGHPCAANPDHSLRQAAKDSKWPVMEFGGR